MTTPFAYEAIDQAGRRVSGIVHEADRHRAMRKLNGQGFHPTRIERAQQQARDTAGEPVAKRKLKRAEVELFIRQLAKMTASSMPLDRALGVIAAVPSDPAAGLAHALRLSLRSGIPPSRSFAQHPEAFDAAIVALIEAGQVSGQMSQALEEAERLLTRRNQLRQQILSASIYPAILVTVAIASVLGILLFVIPRFQSLVVDPSIQLPLAAQVVFGLSAWLSGLDLLLLPVLAALVFGTVSLVRSPAAREALVTALSRLPQVRMLIEEVRATQFCRLAGALLTRNVSLLPALDIAMRMEKGAAATALAEARRHLQEGATLSGALEKTALFPPIVARMARIGEETGTSGAMLLRAADILDERIERRTKRFLVLFQPAILLVLGLVIGGLLYGLFSAILAINQSIL